MENQEQTLVIAFAIIFYFVILPVLVKLVKEMTKK